MTDDFSQKEQMAAQYAAQGKTQHAVKLLFELIVAYAKAKNFPKAEALREKLFEVDAMALNEIIKAAEIIEEEKRGIEAVMPQMLNMFNQEKEKPKEDTLFFKGKNGLKSIFEDQIAEGKEILIVDTSNVAYEMFEIYFHWFDKRRKQKKIPAKIIFNEIEKANKPKIPLAELRYLPKEYSTPAAINIYGNNVAIIHWSKENPFAILIKQKEIADGYRKYFQLLWKSAKK